ncbi:MAG: GNAT family N-acetyltransferase [Bacteroidetes bacterium]|nr:GNAT family N-acetyltransferase [Bacteroidota bacterium]
MKIDVAELSDVPELVQLINSAYRGEISKKGWTTEADLLDGVRTHEKNLTELLNDETAVMLKCTNEEGKIIGSVYLKKHKEKLYLGMLTVMPELQGFGIGKKLLQAAEEYAINNNCTAIFMTVISVRNELIAWYERYGYKNTGKKKPFPEGTEFGIPKQPLEMVFLEKELS